MEADVPTRPVDRRRNENRSDRILETCCIIGLIGSVGVVTANLVGIVVNEKHDPISETISALAIGHYAWIQDLGLYGFAAALMACGIGFLRWRLTGGSWKAAAVLLLLLAPNVAVIAFFNGYAGKTNAGADIHTTSVYLLGGMFPLVPLLSASGIKRIADGWGRFTYVVGVAWLILAPLFLIVPTSWDGAYERVLGLLMVGWVTVISWLMLKQGRGRSLVL